MQATRLLVAFAAVMLLALGLAVTTTAQTNEGTQTWLKFEAPLGSEWKHGPYASREEALEAHASFNGTLNLNGARIVNLRIAEGADPFPRATRVVPPSETSQLTPEPTIPPAPTPTPVPTPINKPPVINAPKEGAKFQVRTGETIRIQVTAKDPEDSSLTYGLLQFPVEMTQDTQTGLIQWTPDRRFTGEERQATFGVRDGDGSDIVRRTIFVTVLAPLPTPTPSPTPTPTLSPVPTATATPAPTATPTPSPTASTTATATPTPSPTPTPAGPITSGAFVATPTPTPVPTPTPTLSPVPTATATPAPTATPTPSPIKVPVSLGVSFTAAAVTVSEPQILVELRVRFRVELWTSVDRETGRIKGVQVLERGLGSLKCGARSITDWWNLESLYGIQVEGLPRIPAGTAEARTAGYDPCGTSKVNIRASQLETVILKMYRNNYRLGWGISAPAPTKETWDCGTVRIGSQTLQRLQMQFYAFQDGNMVWPMFLPAINTPWSSYEISQESFLRLADTVWMGNGPYRDWLRTYAPYTLQPRPCSSMVWYKGEPWPITSVERELKWASDPTLVNVGTAEVPMYMSRCSSGHKNWLENQKGLSPNLCTVYPAPTATQSGRGQPQPLKEPREQALGVRVSGSGTEAQTFADQLNRLSQVAEQFQGEELTQGQTTGCSTAYTVERGDTLSAIAFRHYADASRWRELYDTNKEVIGKNPDFILPGTRLCIPGKLTLQVPSGNQKTSVSMNKAVDEETIRVFSFTNPNDSFLIGEDWYGDSTSSVLTPKASQKIVEFAQSFWTAAVGEPQDWAAVGEPQSLEEDIFLSVLVIGDVRDVVKEGYLFLTRDPQANGWVLTFAAAGVVSTFIGPGDLAPAAFKATAKAIPVIRGSSQLVGEAVEQAMLRTLTSGRIGELGSLSRLTAKLQGKADLSAFEKVLRSPDDTIRLAKYVDETGETGLDLVERIGKQIGVGTGRFQTPQRLQRHFGDHAADTGLSWLGRTFANEQEYLDAARQIVANPASRKVVYYHQSKLDDPTLGYLLEKEGKVFLTAVDDAGNIKTFHWLKEGWGYIQEGFVWNKLFKVDPF